MVVEEFQDKRLKEYGINIRTTFLDGDTQKIRNTDDSHNDNVKSGIILKKEYFLGGVLGKTENIFDSRILYNYEFDGSEDMVCKNCGMNGKVSEFENGCPYCGSSYNIEYDSKELGSKNYYDYVVKDRKYIMKALIKDLIVSLIIVGIYIINTSRTMYFFDILKIVIGTLILGLVLFIFFYYMDAKMILPSIKREKERQNNLQKEFWKRMEEKNVDKIKFFNNMIYLLRELYYSDKYSRVIDFDIIDYDNYQDNYIDNDMFVDVTLDIRIVSFVNGKVVSNREEKTYRFKRLNEFRELKGGVNYIKCPSCGSSIDATLNECSYCGNKINYLQEWYFDKEL